MTGEATSSALPVYYRMDISGNDTLKRQVHFRVLQPAANTGEQHFMLEDAGEYTMDTIVVMEEQRRGTSHAHMIGLRDGLRDTIMERGLPSIVFTSTPSNNDS